MDKDEQGCFLIIKTHFAGDTFCALRYTFLRKSYGRHSGNTKYSIKNVKTWPAVRYICTLCKTLTHRPDWGKPNPNKTKNKNKHIQVKYALPQ